LFVTETIQNAYLIKEKSVSVNKQKGKRWNSKETESNWQNFLINRQRKKDIRPFVARLFDC